MRFLIVALALACFSCSSKESDTKSGCQPIKGGCAPGKSGCAPATLTVASGSTGSARVFAPDPMVGSGQTTIGPTSLGLDNFAREVTLENLTGKGVLEGKYIDVRDGFSCGAYGAYEPSGKFSYLRNNGHFQEAMAYHAGDRFRAVLDSAGYIESKTPVKVVAHCEDSDNAYFVRGIDMSKTVCLGDSVATPGASYGDDAMVVVHELQHATTIDTYSLTQYMNRFWYDEAGALNEAISDFMALIFFAPDITSPFDPRTFSRWALGTFIPNRNGTRGAHKCPTYDSSFGSNCSGFPGFSAKANMVSYVYPDGLGWPYAHDFGTSPQLASVHMDNNLQEEIHNAGVLAAGALWDIYEALENIHGESAARVLSTKLVLEAIKHLPRPDPTNLSPVTFLNFASSLLTSSALLGFTASDQNTITAALAARGLNGAERIETGWASVGAGHAPTAGLRIQDDPVTLVKWLEQIGFSPPRALSLVPQSVSKANQKLDSDELAAVWFDIKNVSEITAGGVLLTIVALDPDVAILDKNVNIGSISDDKAQIQYGKINGTRIVSSLRDSVFEPHKNVLTSNSYFETNPSFRYTWITAVWVRVKSGASGRAARFQITAEPSNGASSQAEFTAQIN